MAVRRGMKPAGRSGAASRDLVRRSDPAIGRGREGHGWGTPERIQQINKVRLELEKLSLREMAHVGRAEQLQTSLQNIVEDMKTAARKEDRLALANLDADFHETLMKASNNPVLLKLWQMLRPQLVIIFGLATLKKSLRKVIDEHRTLLAGLGSLSPEKLAVLMEEHILADNLSIDFLHLDVAEEGKAGRRSKRSRD